MKKYVKCFVGKAGFEPRTLGTKAERHDHCATRPVLNMSKLSKSEPVYPHSILMQEPNDMRETNIEPEIYRKVKVTNNGWCVLDYDL